MEDPDGDTKTTMVGSDGGDNLVRRTPPEIEYLNNDGDDDGMVRRVS